MEDDHVRLLIDEDRKAATDSVLKGDDYGQDRQTEHPDPLGR
jgi:hypothetical protein